MTFPYLLIVGIKRNKFRRGKIPLLKITMPVLLLGIQEFSQPVEERLKNRNFTPNRRCGVPTLDVSSLKCPITRKVLSDSIFTSILWFYVWYSRDKTVPLYRIRVFMARDVQQRAFLILFSCGSVPFLSRQRFISRNKILQID